VKRRTFIAGIGSAAAWPFVVRAQQPAMPVIGYLSAGSPGLNSDSIRAFLKGLSETGYIEGRNMTIEYRWAEDHNDRLPALAADLVRRRVAAIMALGIPPTAAAKAATTTIPILGRVRPGRCRICRNPRPAGRQSHGRDIAVSGTRPEAA
jgi:putative ABC transport system substrate-binding protein